MRRYTPIQSDLKNMIYPNLVEIRTEYSNAQQVLNNNIPPNNGYYQAPNNPYSQAPNNGYYQAPNNPYSQAPNNGYYQAPNNGNYQAPNNAYYQAPNNGNYQAPNNGYYQAPNNAYYQAPNNAYHQLPNNGGQNSNGMAYPTFDDVKTDNSNVQQMPTNNVSDDPRVMIQEDPTIRDPRERQAKAVKFIVHKVEFTDTLDGLSLQYNVSAREIKTFNGLTTNDIYYLKELKIPNPDLQNLHHADMDFDAEEVRRKQKVRTLQDLMEVKDVKAAQFYLDDNNWDINKAYENYRQDIEFENKYQKSVAQNKQQQNIKKKLL